MSAVAGKKHVFPVLKVKRLHPDAILPEYYTAGAACFDLCAVDICGFSVAEHKVLERANGVSRALFLQTGEAAVIRTGLAFEIPDGFVMLIYSRSGHGFNDNARLSNCVAVIDSDYRGEVKVKIAVDGNKRARVFEVVAGDRIAQAMIIPVQQWSLQEVYELSPTERGTQGFGSTGA